MNIRELFQTFNYQRATVVLVILLATSTFAADRWWDGPNDAGAGDGVGQGGTDSWGSANTNWDQGNLLDHTNWVNSANDTAIFEGAPGTVTVTHGNGAQFAALLFHTNYTVNTLAGTTRSLVCGNSSVTVYINTALNATSTINAFITNGPSANRTIKVGGRGTLVLNASNMFSGPIIIGNNAPATNTQGTASFIGGHASGQTPTVQAKIIADLGVASSLGQQSTVANGTIQIGETSTSGVLEYTGTNAASTDRKVQVGSSSNGGGSATIRNNNADSNVTLTFSNPAFNVPATGLTSSGRTLTLAGSNTGDNTIAGQITNNVGGTGLALTKTGSGVWVLGGSNAYSAVTTVSGGLLKLDNAYAIPGGIGASGGTSGLTLAGGVLGLTPNSGNFNRNYGTNVDQVQWTTNGGFAAFGGTWSVQCTNGGSNVTWTALIGNGRTLILGSIVADGTLDWNQSVSMNGAPRTVQVNNGSAAIDAIMSAVINGGSSGNAPFTKTGAGTLAFTAGNSYSGATLINEGTLMLGDGTGDTGRISGNSSNVVISAGAVLAINRTNVISQGGVSQLGTEAAIAGDGSVLVLGGNNGNGGVTMILTNTFTGGVTLNNGRFKFGSDGEAGVGGPAGNGGTFTINGGTIDTADSTARVIVNVNPIAVGGNFAYGGTGNLTLPGDVNLGGATRTITANGSAVLTLTGVVSNGGLVKAGPGVVNLTGTNTYTGDTTVSNGTLKVAVASFDTNSTVSVAAGALLSLDFTGTNIVASFVTNGVALPDGVYKTANMGSFLAGTGSLQVGSVVPSGPTPESITRTVSGGNLILSWTQPSWKLATGTNVTAITNIIPGATSPYTNSLSEPKRFYRLTYP